MLRSNSRLAQRRCRATSSMGDWLTRQTKASRSTAPQRVSLGISTTFPCTDCQRTLSAEPSVFSVTTTFTPYPRWIDSNVPVGNWLAEWDVSASCVFSKKAFSIWTNRLRRHRSAIMSSTSPSSIAPWDHIQQRSPHAAWHTPSHLRTARGWSWHRGPTLVHCVGHELAPLVIWPLAKFGITMVCITLSCRGHNFTVHQRKLP